MWIFDNFSVAGLFVLSTALAHEIIYIKQLQRIVSAIPGSLLVMSRAVGPISIAIAFDVSSSHIQTAFVTIYSIFRCFCPLSCRLSCWVIVLDLTPSTTLSSQLSCIQHMQPSVHVSLIQFNRTVAHDIFQGIRERRLIPRPWLLFRLYYLEFLTEDLVISMDTDMYAGRHFLPELVQIITQDVNKSVIYAVRDLWVMKNYHPRFHLNLSRYINAGFFAIRNNEDGKALMRLARDQLIKWIGMAWHFEQDALNLAIDLKPWSLYHLPGYFNCMYAWCLDQHIDRQAIHHRKQGAAVKLLRDEYGKKCVHS
jgi:lipopolysaccharide biosynthesis glycosyltransferase